MATYTSFEQLDCWKRCRDLGQWVTDVVNRLPSNERFDMGDNLRRAVRSSTRNIAEGFGRFHFKENIQFCRMSRGSIFELWDDIITCHQEGYISTHEYNAGVVKIKDCIKSLNGYIAYLRRRAQQDSRANK